MNPTSEILDAMPPSDAQAEQWVVGSAILRPSVLDDLGFLSDADFYTPDLRTIYSALTDMRSKGQPIDVGLLARHLRSEGWSARIAEIVTGIPTTHHATHYARRVEKLAKYRRLREIAVDLLQRSQAASDEPEEVLEHIETDLAGIRLTDADGEPVTMLDAATQAFARIDEIQRRGESPGVPTGLSNFDNDMGGLFPGELAILAARPGVGKTSLAAQIGTHNGERGRLVYFASLEMSAAELSTRLACSESGVSNRLVRIGKLDQDHGRRLAESLNRQASMTLEIHDRSSLTVAAIRREIRKRAKRGLCLAIVDYLQLIAPDDRRLPREQQVARIVRSLKETAREYQIPILCLCQLNRQADGDEIPRLSHLRESGAIEQDADVVLFLSEHKPTDDEPHNAVLTIAKNRNGETGPLRLNWDAPTTRFSCPAVPQLDEFMEFAK